MRPATCLSVFVFLTLSFCLGHAATTPAPATPPENAPTVFVKKAALADVSQNLSYPAVVQARVQATVLSEADGVVRRIHSHLGQAVGRGARLFTIQQTDPIYQYAAISTPSPVSGIVSELTVTEGALVTKGQKLANVTDPKSVKILVEIPAQDLALLNNGSTGVLESPSLPNKVMVSIRGLSPSVDPATGTATAELVQTKEDTSLLRPGLVGKVTFNANVHRGYLVTEDALIEVKNETFLRVVEDGKAKKIPVTVASRMRGFAEIAKGLRDGMLVVERASGFVGDGDLVKVQE